MVIFYVYFGCAQQRQRCIHFFVVLVSGSGSGLPGVLSGEQQETVCDLEVCFDISVCFFLYSLVFLSRVGGLAGV